MTIGLGHLPATNVRPANLLLPRSYRPKTVSGAIVGAAHAVRHRDLGGQSDNHDALCSTLQKGAGGRFKTAKIESDTAVAAMMFLSTSANNCSAMPMNPYSNSINDGNYVTACYERNGQLFNQAIINFSPGPSDI